AYTAKILQTLVKSQIVNSVKGPHGGFEIEGQKMDTLVLNDIVRAIDGEKLIHGCCMRLPQCKYLNPCPADNRYIPVKEELINMLNNTTVYELAKGYQLGMSTLSGQSNKNV